MRFNDSSKHLEYFFAGHTQLPTYRAVLYPKMDLAEWSLACHHEFLDKAILLVDPLEFAIPHIFDEIGTATWISLPLNFLRTQIDYQPQLHQILDPT